MNRRQLLALLSAPAVAAFVTSCGNDDADGADDDPNDDPGGDDGDDPGAGLVRSSLPRLATTAADAAAASAAIERFGIDLHRRLAAASAGNIVVSPMSIATALSMVLAGAGGATYDELVATVRIDDPATIHRSMNALLAELERIGGAGRGVELTVASSLWAQQGLGFEAPFLDTLAAEYGSGLHVVDYVADPDGARLDIDDWVDERTAGRIPELLPDGAITADTRLTVVDLVHLSAAWQVPFAPGSTQPGPFTGVDGTTVEVPMMTATRSVPYASGDGWQAVELLYEGGELAMLLLVPEPGFLADFEQIFLLTDATRYLAPTGVRLTMPTFEIGTAAPLGRVLREMGMATAFTSDADLRGMTSQERLRIAEVVHQANITVDEAGSEAAAATAVIGEAVSAPAEPPVEVTLDRPFVFALRHLATGAVLFLGRVGELGRA